MAGFYHVVYTHVKKQKDSLAADKDSSTVFWCHVRNTLGSLGMIMDFRIENKLKNKRFL